MTYKEKDLVEFSMQITRHRSPEIFYLKKSDCVFKEGKFVKVKRKYGEFKRQELRDITIEN